MKTKTRTQPKPVDTQADLDTAGKALVITLMAGKSVGKTTTAILLALGLKKGSKGLFS